MQQVAIEGHPRRWTQQIRLPIATRGLERVRPRHLPLLEHRLPGRRGDIEPVVRDDAPVVHRVLGGCAKRDEPRLPLERRAARGRRPARPSLRRCRAPRRVGAQRADLVAADDPREPADTNGHRMDGAPADPRRSRCRPSSAEAALHGRPVVWPGRERSGNRASPADAAGRHAGRGSRSIPRNTAAGEAHGRRVDLDPEAASAAWTAVIW